MQTQIDTKYYSPNDAAKVCGCSGATIKRLADEMRLPIEKTVGGIRLFTEKQVETIAVELQRRMRGRGT